ncbi:MAG: DUF6531 domain-containing protein [bacterium]
MIAAKFMDIVVGVDIHWVLVPAPPSPSPIPTPLPHPFTGVIFDPVGIIAGAAISAASSVVFGTPFNGPVLINSMPAANTGTGCTNKLVMPHFPTPPGVGWAPVPGGIKPPIPGKPPSPPIPSPVPTNDGIIITGSKTVYFSGNNAARLGSRVMSCGDPVRLPSSTVLALPMGAPVLVGGPPALDFMAVFMGMLKTQWAAARLHGLVSRVRNARLRNFLHRAVCFITGHPVDVMTGKVFTESVDFKLPGPIPFKFERVYYSTSTYDGPLGYGWHHSYDQHIRIEKYGIVFRTEDGREVDFRHLKDGESSYDPIECLELKRSEDVYIVTTKGRLKLYFGSKGRADGILSLLRITDLNGNEVTLNYDNQGRLVEIIDSVGRRILFRNDGKGRIIKMSAPAKEGTGYIDVMRFEYDENGDLITSYDALGHTYEYKYKHHLLVQETNRNGLSFYFEYDGIDESAWCIRTWGDGGIYDHLITYDKQKHITVVEDSLGAKNIYYGNEFGLVTKRINPEGGETLYEWDNYCRKVSQTDPNGAIHKWEYDSDGNLISYQDPLGNTIQYTIEQTGLSVNILDALGYTWREKYNDKGSFMGTIDPMGGNWQIIRDDQGRIANVMDPIGSRLRFEYDNYSNVVAESDWEGNFYRFGYDNWGQIISRSNPLGEEIRFTRDNLGRIIETIFPDGSKTQRQYDPEGNLISLIDANGKVQQWRYAGVRKVIEKTDSAGNCMHYSYDTEERLISVENQNGELYSYEYNLSGKLISETDFSGRKTQYIYGNSGYCQEIIKSNGQRVGIKRDLLGRITERVFSDEERISYKYNAVGNIVEATNFECKLTIEYDPLGRIINETTGNFSVESTYDIAGNRINRKTNTGTESIFDYDRNGLLIGLRQGVNYGIIIKRDPAGREIERKLNDRLFLHQEFDKNGRLQSQLVFINNKESTIVRRKFLYDSLGNLKAIHDDHWGNITHEFDAKSQLTNANRQKGYCEAFEYDKVGNIIKWSKLTPSGSPIQEDTTEYSKGGRILRKGATKFEYDKCGFLVHKTQNMGDAGIKEWHYKWKLSGVLEEVSNSDGQRWSFQYDPFGRRISKSGHNGKIHYMWDGDTLAQEVSEEDTLREWFFQPGSYIPIARKEHEDWSLCITNQIGALTDMINGNGELEMSVLLGIWGDAIDIYPSGSRRSLAFQGQWVDEEFGLHWNMYRYYDPQCGRYLSPDPMGLSGGYHPYQYAYYGNPTTTIDPLGLMPFAWNSESGMGHHLVPRGRANSVGLTDLGTPRDTPTFFPTPYEQGMHESIHRAQRPHIGRLQGPWTGTADELLEVIRRGFSGFIGLDLGELSIPSTGQVLANVAQFITAQAFDKLIEWYREQTGGKACS